MIPKYYEDFIDYAETDGYFLSDSNLAEDFIAEIAYKTRIDEIGWKFFALLDDSSDNYHIAKVEFRKKIFIPVGKEADGEISEEVYQLIEKIETEFDDFEPTERSYYYRTPPLRRGSEIEFDVIAEFDVFTVY